MQPREPGAPSPHPGGEGGAGQDPILESQVGDSEGGARRTPQLPLWLAAGWEPSMLARISAPLFPWRGLQLDLQYANNVQTA